jgi:hypothetical protein
VTPGPTSRNPAVRSERRVEEESGGAAHDVVHFNDGKPSTVRSFPWLVEHDVPEIQADTSQMLTFQVQA